MPFFLAFTRGGEYDTGIPIEHLDKIFDPFFTTRPDGEGAGLGLSASFMVVRNHGGRIEVESAARQGSMFHVFLPTSGSGSGTA